MNSWLSFIFSKQFIKHGIFMAISFIAFIFLLFFWFGIYTQHNKSLTLNDLSELTLDQAVKLLESKGLGYVIADSSSFNPDYLPLAVIQQNPAPQAKVKNGRTIYLWLNAGAPPYKSIPCLMGNATIDEAFDRLPQVGFEIGEITYKPMEELKEGNPILKMFIGEKEIKCGDKAQWGQKIDLIVGEKARANKVEIPMLLGSTFSTAEFLLNADLNFGTIIYEMEGMIDSSSAVIYKQLPDYGDEALRVGSTIDIWLIQDLPAEISTRIESMKNDTTSSDLVE
jgi:beta-lactam-binding protein with PASTA domain